MPSGVRISEHQNKVIMELYQQGLTDAEISRRMGLWEGTILQWRKRRGLPTNNPTMHKWRPREKSVEAEIVKKPAKLTEFKPMLQVDIATGKVLLDRRPHWLRREVAG